jgi:acyl-coenzyme A thioesterase PaaI-like protein
MVKQIQLEQVIKGANSASVNKEKLEAHAKIIHKDSRTAVGDIEVVNERGKLVAKLVTLYRI